MLAFVHIPKTAGTTLHKIATHQIPPSKTVIHHDTDGEISKVQFEEWKARGVELVLGHFSVGLHRHDPTVRYITCVREPVSRIVSHFNHALNDPAHYLHKHVKGESLSIAGYVTETGSGELRNGMTRMLAGVDDFDGAVVTAGDLEIAKENILNHFGAIILSERFDEGVVLAAKILGWSSPWYLRRKVGRYTAMSAELTPTDRQVIEEQNFYDLQLYDWIKERFEDGMKAHPELAEEVARFSGLNPWFGKWKFLVREFLRRRKRKSIA